MRIPLSEGARRVADRMAMDSVLRMSNKNEISGLLTQRFISIYKHVPTMDELLSFFMFSHLNHRNPTKVELAEWTAYKKKHTFLPLESRDVEEWIASTKQLGKIRHERRVKNRSTVALRNRNKGRRRH